MSTKGDSIVQASHNHSMRQRACSDATRRPFLSSYRATSSQGGNKEEDDGNSNEIIIIIIIRILKTLSSYRLEMQQALTFE